MGQVVSDEVGEWDTFFFGLVQQLGTAFHQYYLYRSLYQGSFWRKHV
jgi:hypothetical protein